MGTNPRVRGPQGARSASSSDPAPNDTDIVAESGVGSIRGDDTGAAPASVELAPARLVSLIATLAVGVAIWYLPAPAGVKPAAIHLLAIFVATIVGIITKPLPMGAVALIGIMATAFSGTLTPEKALSGFSNSVIWLIVIAFFIARGFIKTGLGHRIAYFFVSKLGKRTLGLSYGLVATDLLIAPAIPSNTARAGAVVFPIVRSLSTAYGSEPNSPSSRGSGPS